MKLLQLFNSNKQKIYKYQKLLIIMKNYLPQIGALLMLMPLSEANANIDYAEKCIPRYYSQTKKEHFIFPKVNNFPLEIIVEVPLPPAQFCQPAKEAVKKIEKTEDNSDKEEHNLLKEAIKRDNPLKAYIDKRNK